jgi:hypothetical protein
MGEKRKYIKTIVARGENLSPGELVKITADGELARWTVGDEEQCVGALPPTVEVEGPYVYVPDCFWPFGSIGSSGRKVVGSVVTDDDREDHRRNVQALSEDGMKLARILQRIALPDRGMRQRRDDEEPAMVYIRQARAIQEATPEFRSIFVALVLTAR